MQLKHLSGLSNTGIVYYFIYFFGIPISFKGGPRLPGPPTGRCPGPAGDLGGHQTPRLSKAPPERKFLDPRLPCLYQISVMRKKQHYL